MVGRSQNASTGWARREPRVAVDLKAEILGRVVSAARVVDLSYLGCLVRSEAAPARGAVVDLQLELPDGLLRTKARVAEASLDGESLPGPGSSFLTGLEFFALAAADEQRLHRFVDGEVKRRRGEDAAAR